MEEIVTTIVVVFLTSETKFSSGSCVMSLAAFSEFSS